MTMFRRLLSSNLGLQGTDSATTVDLLVCIEAYCSPCETMPSVESDLSELVESCVANGISADGFDILDFLFGEAKFTGNRSSYGSSTNSMLVSVLETRRGIPISLCVVAQALLQRLGHPSHLVGLPGHVVLGMGDAASVSYVDCFNGGRRLSYEQCVAMIVASGSTVDLERTLSPMSPALVALRTLNNLIGAFGAERDQVGLARAAAMRLSIPFLSSGDIRATQALLAMTN